MPNVIDQVKIGQLIKQLLKKHNMTQDQLAQHLNITKSAVSQNLNGKSTFDIQNLITIAKLFDITLDDLLSLSDSGKGIKSKYELLVEKGIESISTVSPQQLIINTPDMYGFVLIEYIMQNKNFIMFDYLFKNHISYVENTYHRAPEIILQVLLFILEHDRSYFDKNLDLLVIIENQFMISNEKLENVFYNLLDLEKNKLPREYFLKKALEKQPIIKPKNYIDYKLNKSILIEKIGKYHLKNLLVNLLSLSNLEPMIYPLTKNFVKYQFYVGLDLVFDQLFNDNPSGMKQVVYQIQEVALLVVDTCQVNLIMKMLNRNLFVNMTQIFEKILLTLDKKLIQWVIENYHQTINFNKLDISSLHENIVLVNIILPYLNETNKNIILSRLNQHHLNLIKHLIKNGAKFDMNYYTQNTFETINALVDSLINKE